MPRNGSNVYSKPAGTTAVSGTPIESVPYNSTIDDLVADANLSRPEVAGGTGASTFGGARDNLGISAKEITKSAAYTAVAGDRGLLIRSTAAMTLSLAAAATLGDGWFIDVLADTGDLTINPDAAETIDTAATLVVPSGRSARIRCNGTAFYSQFLQVGATFTELLDDTTPQQGGPLDTNGHPVDFSQGVSVATASEALLLRDGNVFNFTGTATVDTIENTANAWPVASVVYIRADGVFTMTHSADLLLTGAADITTEAGDWFILQKYAPGDWRMMFYQRASGRALVSDSSIVKFSPELTIATGDTTHAHGGVAAPRNATWALVCQTAEHGYSVGDTIFPEMMLNGNGGNKIVTTASSIILNIPTTTIIHYNRTSAAAVNLTLANWNVVFSWVA